MSGFEARFEDDKLTAIIEDTGKNWFNVEVDGVVRALSLKKGRHTYTLFSGAKGKHAIRVTRRTGALEGTTVFVSISAAKLQPTHAPLKRLLVIGDSISAGYGVEGEDQNCRFSQATQNAAKAWPALLANSYAAELQLIAVDGRGVYRNYNSDAPTMPQLMDRVLPSQGKIWQETYTPQLIIVNVGTNDFGMTDPGAAFDRAYLALLNRLRAENPEATIVAAIGGMLQPDSMAKLKTKIDSAVMKRRAAGDPKILAVYFDPPVKGRRYGCDWHPGQDAQIYMAQTLQAMIGQSLGWQGKPIN